jgi:hypothetical protein
MAFQSAPYGKHTQQMGAAALFLVISSVACATAQEAVTIGGIVAKGGKVESVVTSQDYPNFVLSTPGPNANVYFCALSVDEALKFFDYRLPTSPASIGSRCSELK